MTTTDEDKLEKTDNEILFSRAVKAGKRVYYIDVKQDRRGEFYISMTESKRLKESGVDGQPLFEKHKLFLYREDFEKFTEALSEATAYVSEQRSEEPDTDAQPADGGGSSEGEDGGDALKADNFRLDIEF